MQLFSFVILHYNTFDDTVDCIDSIFKNIDYPNYHIVVVENGSKNNSGMKLFQKYNGVPKITVLINQLNLGFAKGNNIGFRYSKYILKADFISLINNDTVIYQNNFVSKVIEKYESTKFHILGPDIISTIDNSHQNPRDENLDTLINIKKHVRHFQKLLILNYLFLDEYFVKIKKKILPNSNLPRTTTDISSHYKEELLNVKLHGSAIIFSPDFINKYDGLYPKTFMYSEESILYYIAKRDYLTTIYFPEIKIYHKEDSATNSLFKSKMFKRRFYLKNFVKSGKEFIKLIEEDNKISKNGKNNL